MSHFDNFDVRDAQKADLEFLKANPRFQELWERDWPMFTLMCDGKPIIILGMQNSGIGTYYPMAFVGKGIDKHRFAVIRYVYDYIEKFVGSDLRRLEAYVSVYDKEAQRFAEFFGFEAIGIRRMASVDGQDQIIYERLGRK